MRAKRPQLFSVCLLIAATASALSAQNGGKKHHKPDSASVATSASSYTFKSGQTVSSPFFVMSDAAFKSDVSVSSGEVPAQQIFPVQSIAPIKNNNATFGVQWNLLDKPAYLALGFNDLGWWSIYGLYTSTEKSSQFLEVVFAIKKKDGDVLIFHYLGKIAKGQQGPGSEARILPTPFEELKNNGFEVRGAYRLLDKTVAKSEGAGLAATSACSTPDKVAAGWGDIWSWVDPHKTCTQYNVTQ
jgi:hypothetical protein